MNLAQIFLHSFDLVDQGFARLAKDIAKEFKRVAQALGRDPEGVQLLDCFGDIDNWGVGEVFGGADRQDLAGVLGQRSGRIDPRYRPGFAHEASFVVLRAAAPWPNRSSTSRGTSPVIRASR